MYLSARPSGWEFRWNTASWSAIAFGILLAAGRKRALSVCLLSGGYSQAELEQSGALRVYADPADMLQHVEDIGIG